MGDRQCIACNYPKDRGHVWRDIQCPKCYCPQHFSFVAPKWLPISFYSLYERINKYYFHLFRWPSLREHYLDMVWVHEDMEKRNYVI